MSVEANKETMRSFFNQVITEGNVDLLDRIATNDFRYTDGDHVVTSAADMKELVSGYRVSLSGLRATVEDVFGEGDKVATRVHFTGKHDGDLMGVGPTGTSVAFTLTMVSQFAGDKISEVWINWDALAVLEQIGGKGKTS